MRDKLQIEIEEVAKRYTDTQHLQKKGNSTTLHQITFKKQPLIKRNFKSINPKREFIACTKNICYLDISVVRIQMVITNNSSNSSKTDDDYDDKYYFFYYYCYYNLWMVLQALSDEYF